MTDDDPKLAACRRRAKFRQYLAAFLANLSAFSIGTILGWTAPMQPLLTASETPPVGTEPISEELFSWLSSVNFIGSVLGTFFWGILSDRLGRKKTASLVVLPYVIGWIMTLTAKSIWWLISARLIMGLGCSGTFINTPIYIAELAEPKIRGSLGSFLIIFVNAGYVFSYIVGSLTSYHGLASISLSIPIIFLISFNWLPESPVYLWTHGKKIEAEKSMIWFRGGDTVQTIKEIEELKSRPASPKKKSSLRDLVSTKGTVKALIIGLGIAFGHQFCGNPAITAYTVRIFQESGSFLTAHNSMIFVGVLKLVFITTCSYLVDRAGRRILLIFSFLGMALSLAIMGIYLVVLGNTNQSSLLSWIPILSLSFSMIFYAIGVGPVPFIVFSEIFPAEIRGYAVSKVELFSSSMAFACIKTFPFIKNVFGYHGCFLFYSLVCILSSVFIFFTLPETKGKTLQTILNEMNGEIVTKVVLEQTELVPKSQTSFVK